MAVRSELATLMRVIEEQQDKMPEGEYLAAMNALGALHRQSSADLPAAVIQQVPLARPAQQVNLFASHRAEVLPDLVQMTQDDRAQLNRVKFICPEHKAMTQTQWMALSEEDRRRLNIESVEKLVDMKESSQRNPDPRVCPFIARHAVGSWRIGSEYPSHTKEWCCVCGYTGKTKHWKKHEESERHQDWAKHRTVSRRTIEKMKTMISDDEAGDFIPLKPHSQDRSGIRCFTVSQEKNEWTHPELYMDFHRSPNSEGKWFVHRREDWARIYVQ